MIAAAVSAAGIIAAPLVSAALIPWCRRHGFGVGSTLRSIIAEAALETTAASAVTIPSASSTAIAIPSAASAVPVPTAAPFLTAALAAALATAVLTGAILGVTAITVCAAARESRILGGLCAEECETIFFSHPVFFVEAPLRKSARVRSAVRTRKCRRMLSRTSEVRLTIFVDDGRYA